jgi:hypothetical protein
MPSIPIYEICVVLDDEPWQMADPLLNGDVQELQCGKHLQKYPPLS